MKIHHQEVHACNLLDAQPRSSSKMLTTFLDLISPLSQSIRARFPLTPKTSLALSANHLEVGLTVRYGKLLSGGDGNVSASRRPNMARDRRSHFEATVEGQSKML